jgi:hypothetical protein
VVALPASTRFPLTVPVRVQLLITASYHYGFKRRIPETDLCNTAETSLIYKL